MADLGNPKVTQPASAQAPKSLPKTTGWDYHSVNDDDSDDNLRDDFCPGLTIVDSPGYAGKPRR